jgi:hypothetical protein
MFSVETLPLWSLRLISAAASKALLGIARCGKYEVVHLDGKQRTRLRSYG